MAKKVENAAAVREISRLQVKYNEEVDFKVVEDAKRNLCNVGGWSHRVMR